jgi:hypothetical protein
VSRRLSHRQEAKRRALEQTLRKLERARPKRNVPSPMHESFEDYTPGRDIHGHLVDLDGCTITEDARCEECAKFVALAGLQFYAGKYRCYSCCRFWDAELKPKPGLQSALWRAQRVGQPATLTEEQWQRTLKRFKNVCAYCQTNAWRHVEHVTPLPFGGTTIDNCLPACPMCNAFKRGRTLEEMVAACPTEGHWANALAWLRSQGRSNR